MENIPQTQDNRLLQDSITNCVAYSYKLEFGLQATCNTCSNIRKHSHRKDIHGWTFNQESLSWDQVHCRAHYNVL